MGTAASPAPNAGTSRPHSARLPALCCPGGFTPVAKAQRCEYGPRWVWRLRTALATLVAPLPPAPEQQEKRHLLAALPAGPALPVPPRNLAPGRARGLRGRFLAPRRSRCRCSALFLGLLLPSGRRHREPPAPRPAAPASRAEERELRHPLRERWRWRGRTAAAPLLPGAPRPAAPPHAGPALPPRRPSAGLAHPPPCAPLPLAPGAGTQLRARCWRSRSPSTLCRVGRRGGVATSHLQLPFGVG